MCWKEGVKVDLTVTTAKQIGRRNSTTDATGKWRVENVSDVKEIAARYAHPDYISDSNFNESGTPPPVEQFIAGTAIHVMRKGVDLEGTVLDPEGKTLSDAIVRLGINPRDKNEQTKSDIKGHFQFRNLRPGSLFVTVEKWKYAPDLQTINIAQGLKPIELHLGTPNTIRFHIQDPEGNPIQGAQVTAFSWRNAFSLRMGRFTDNQGNVVWESAPADTVLYDVLATGFMYARRQALVARDEPYVITMKRPLKVTAKVIDAATRAPIKDFKIIPSWNVTGEKVEWHDDTPKHGKEGAFTDTIDEPYERHYYRIEAPDYLAAISRPFTDDEPEVSLEIALQKAESLKGVVLAPDGQPAAGAELKLITEKTTTLYSNLRLQNPPEGTLFYSDEQGRYTIPLREEKFGVVVVHEKGFVAIEDKDLAQTHEIRLTDWARVEGKAFLGDKPAARASISLFFRLNPQVAGLTYHPSYETVADDEGRFSFERVMPLGATFVYRRAPSSSSNPSSCSAGLFLRPGASGHVQVGGMGRPLKGRVLKPDPAAPVEFSRGYIYLDPAPHSSEKTANSPQTDEQWAEERRYSTTISDDGSFLIHDVIPGKYILGAVLDETPSDPSHYVQRAAASARREIEVSEIAGGRTDEVLDVGELKTAPIDSKSGDSKSNVSSAGTDGSNGPSGIVLLPGGEPASGAELSLIGGDPDWPPLAGRRFQTNYTNGINGNAGNFGCYTAGPDGRFQLPAVPGKLAVAVKHDAGFLLVNGEDLKKNSEIRLREYATVEGKVFKGDLPSAGETVVLDGNFPWGNDNLLPSLHWHSTSDKDGKFVFSKVPPVKGVAVAREVALAHNSSTFSHRAPVELKPGQTTRVRIGGSGRPVIGRVTGMGNDGTIDLSWGSVAFAPRIQTAQFPGATANPWLGTYYTCRIQSDGTFRIDDVPPGTHEYRVTIRGKPFDEPTLFLGTPDIATATGEIEVPTAAEGKELETVDLGEFTLKSTMSRP